jgi:hypothetical protein
MSMPDSAPPPLPPPASYRYSGGQIFMIVAGVILLLPGLCSIAFIIGMQPDFSSKSLSDPISQMIFALWAICLAVSAIGIVLIVVARKRARMAA